MFNYEDNVERVTLGLYPICRFGRRRTLSTVIELDDRFCRHVTKADSLCRHEYIRDKQTNKQTNKQTKTNHR
jgi:hypothetical protein